MTTDGRDKDTGTGGEVSVLFQKLQNEFAEAEYAIKQGELSVQKLEDESRSIVFQGVFFPAINELRYAGKHMSDFNVSGRIEDLSEAIFHCMRAKNDAYDCLVQYRLRDIRSFMEQYKSVVISEVISDYGECLSKINSVKDRCGKRSEEVSANTRLEDYNTLKDVCDKFDFYRDDLNAKLKKENTDRFCKIVGTFASVLILIVAIIALFI